MFQILDIFDKYTAGVHEIVLVGRTAEGVQRVVRVVGAPKLVSVAIGPDFRDAEGLSAELNNHLRRMRLRCRKHGCECGGDEYGIYREDCPLAIGNIDWNPVVGYRTQVGYGSDLYEPTERSFIEFNLTHPYFFGTAQRFLDNQVLGSLPDKFRGVYNASTNGVDSFMIAKELASFDWVAVGDNVNIIPYSKLVKVQDPPTLPAPFTTLVFDIETLAKIYLNSGNRDAKYPVGSINCQVVKNKVVVENRTFLLKSECVLEDDIASPGLVVYPSEVELLEAFRHFFLEVNPGFVAGHNINGFDMPYLLARAKGLGIRNFSDLSAFSDMPIIYRLKEKTKGKQQQNVHVIDCPGRIFLDTLQISRDTISLPGYKLNDVAKIKTTMVTSHSL